MTSPMVPGRPYPALPAALSFPSLRHLAVARDPAASTEDVLTQVTAMGTGPACLWNLTEGPLAQEPLSVVLTALRDRLRDGREKPRAVAHLLRWEKGARDVCEFLARASLPAPLVLKGGATKYTLYPAPHLRSSADLDLLLPPDVVRPAVAALEGIGYAPRSVARREWTARHGNEVMLTRDGHVVELHRTVDYHDWPALSYPVLMQEATELPQLHAGVFAPGLADTCLIAAAHALSHGLLVPLRDLVDIQLALEHPKFDLPALQARAHASGLHLVLAFAVLQAGTLSDRWTPAHSALAQALPGYPDWLLSEWRYGGLTLPDGRIRLLAANLLLVPGISRSLRLTGLYLRRRWRDLLDNVGPDP